ncbi:hypothetical protein [Fodinicola feengrottensis]|uniref:hypothetical protein n=1 Tax=Fodinicola feengrottensis TaxID=435914 RepID=UPI0013D78EDA|nr:hypothetical protein [Fodinicola feengrottensis]
MPSALVAGPDDWDRCVQLVGTPAVLKPVRGQGSRDAYPIEDPHAGADLVRRLAERGTPFPMQLEHFLRGRASGPFADYVSVESTVCDGRIAHLAITGKLPMLPPFREVGEFWPAVLPEAEKPAVLDLTTAAIQALGVRFGMVHTEIKLTNDGPRIIEVNGRLAGYLNGISVRAAGLDFVRTAALVALGEDVRLPPPRYDGVFFSFATPAPRLRGTLVSVKGIGEVSRLPGIVSYRRYVSPGGAIHDGVGTQRLDIVSGQAPDHQAMLDLIDQARKALTFTFATEEGTTVRSGQDLLNHAAKSTFW